MGNMMKNAIAPRGRSVVMERKEIRDKGIWGINDLFWLLHTEARSSHVCLGAVNASILAKDGVF